MNLIEIYLSGFNDYLDEKTLKLCDDFESELELRAYNLGVLDAYYGDESNNIAYQTEYDIIRKIFNI